MLPDFQQNQKIEAQDQYGKWYLARVVEVDQEEKELLIHFEGWNIRYDEWISCNSFRLRPLSIENKRKLQEKKLKKFQVGDLVQARWVNRKYYPAKVKVIDNLCEKVTVQFQDNVEHSVSLKDVRAQKKPDKQSDWAKLQQEAKEREDRHIVLARKSRAKKRTTAELDILGDSPGQSSPASKKPRVENDKEGGSPSLEDSASSQGSAVVSESVNVLPSSPEGLKSPGASKRKAYTPLRTQYSLRETVVPIQPLSQEQHGKGETPSKITRRINSFTESEDPLSSDSAKSKGRGGVGKKGKQEESSGKRKRVSSKEATEKQSKKVEHKVTPTASVFVIPVSSSAPCSAVVPVSLPEPIFLTPPLDSNLTVAGKTLSVQSVHPTPPYTPTHQASHVSSCGDHPDQSLSIPQSPSIASSENLSINERKGTPSSCDGKSSPSKSISLTCFNVDILNNEDSKSTASPAVVTIDPTAITHSPLGDNEPTSSVTECSPDESRPFVECTKKTASIISKSSPKRPSLLPFRKRCLSATTSQTTTRRSLSTSKQRTKSEGGRSNLAKRQHTAGRRASHRTSAMAEREKDMAPKELVIKMDHNDFKCRFASCGKSFRKESLLQWHYKHYHPGRVQQSNVTSSPKIKSPVHKSSANKQPPNPSMPTPPTLLAVAKQHEHAVQSATQAISSTATKPQPDKVKIKKESAVTTSVVPIFSVVTPPSAPLAGTSLAMGGTKELPIFTKVSVPKEPIISPFLPIVTAVSSIDVKKVKELTGLSTSLASLDSIKLPSSIAMELLKGSAVRMVAPKPTVIQTATPISSTSSILTSPAVTPLTPSSIGSGFKGFPPVTTTNNSTPTGKAASTGKSFPTFTQRPTSPLRKGVVIRGHPRGEILRPRGAIISHVSDDSSLEDLDVGEEYRPSVERHPRASRPFGSSSCSYYCSGNKDDVIHCLCGSFEDEGFMIQCEQCLCWQHADCVGIDEEQPPEHYLCCICQSPHALRKNARFKYNRSWYKDGNLPSLKGGAAFTRSADVANTHKISSSLTSLSQCLHSLDQLLTVAGQPLHPLLKHWDSGKESATTRKLTERLTAMLKEKESADFEEDANLSDASGPGDDSNERSARTTPITDLHLGRGAIGGGNQANKLLQLPPLPPVGSSSTHRHTSDDQQSIASHAPTSVTPAGSLQLPPLLPHRRRLFDEESNCSTPGLRSLSTISTPIAEEEHSGLDLLTEVAATCSRLSTPSTISQDKSTTGDSPGDQVMTSVAGTSSWPVASFLDEFGMEEASVFALTPSTVTTPDQDQPMDTSDLQTPSAPPSRQSLHNDDERSQTGETENQNMQSIMELVERLTSNLDTTAQLLPMATPSQFADAFMKVDTSCWASRMLLLDHVEAMQEKVLAQMDELEQQFKGITAVEYSPKVGGSKKELVNKMTKWQNLGITSVA